MQLLIYLSKNEFRDAAEAYLNKNHFEFINGLLEICWTSYYNANIHQIVSFCIESLLLNIQNTE